MRWSPVLMGASWARLAQTAAQSVPRNLFRPFVQACTSGCVTMPDHLPADITHKPGCSTSTTAGLYAACAVFSDANERAALVADAFGAMLTSAGRCEAVVTS